MSNKENCAIRLKLLFDTIIDIELENWITFVEQGKIVSLRKNTILKKPHTIEKNLSFILNGNGGILKWHKNGYICLGFAFQDDFLCDYVSLLEQEESDLETLVFEDSDLFQISHEKLIIMFQSKRGEKLRRLIAEGIMQSQQESTKEFMTKTASSRYKELLLKHPDVLERVPQKYIASYLGITPQSFSRIKKNSHS